jgi:hypothetical protein
MPAYPLPADQWFANQLAAVKGTAQLLNSGGTEYVVEYPKRKAGDTRKESERGVSVAITGNLEYDHKGNKTGLLGWGQAVYNTGTSKWVKVE